MTLLSAGKRTGPLLMRLRRLRRPTLTRQTLASLATAVLWQLANYAIPLATFPYLARVLGVRGFGILALATAVASYATLVTDWGFNLTATQAIARVRDDAEAANAIIWSTIGAKAMLGSLSCAVVVLASLVVPIDGTLREVTLFALLGVLASVFTIDWALRGVERIRSFATASILGRLVSIPATFLLVRHADDVAFAALSGAMGSVSTAVLSLGIGARLGLVGRPVLAVRQSLVQIWEGVHIFLSMAAVSLYTSCLAIILGWASGPAAVGLFNGADRLRRPVQSLLSPIELVFYPRLSALAATDPPAARRLALSILGLQGAVSLALSLGLAALAPQAVHLVLGPGFEAAVPVLRILSAVVFLVGVNNVLGLMVLLPFGLRRQFSLCTVVGAVVGAGLAVPLSIRFGAEGAAVAAASAELGVLLATFVAARAILFGRATLPAPAAAESGHAPG